MSEWRLVPGHELTHEISSAGEVRNRRTGKLLQPVLGGRYLQVGFWEDGRTVSRRVHVLVCQAFHGPRPHGLSARHLDDDESNNSASNLAWGTQSQNMQDSIHNGTNARLARTHCPRNHLLDGENLVRSIARLGRRNCRACHQARAKLFRASCRGEVLDFSAVADAAYSRLVAATPQGVVLLDQAD